MDRRKIAYLKFIFEGYEGIAVISTLDSEQGLIQIHVAPGCEETVMTILKDLSQRIKMEDMDPSLVPRPVEKKA